MENVPVKVTGDNLTAVEYNTGLQTEAKNAVTSSGQTLSGGDLYQLSKSMAIYTASGDFYVDSGTVNNYVLSTVASMQAPIQYIDGMSVRFRVANTNTGASQVNVTSLGLKDILRKDRVSPLSAGDLPINQHAVLIYHSDIDAFTLSDTLAEVVIPNEIWGLTMSNDAGDLTHDIAISTGGGVDNFNSYLLLNTGIIKKTDANWAVGTNAGGFPSGITLTANTCYHVFLIGKTDGTTDAGFDTSLTATNLRSDATGYTKYLRVGSFYTDAAATTIRAFYHFVYNNGRRVFLWKSPIVDVADTNPGISAVLKTLHVPLGINIGAMLNVALTRTGGSGVASEVYVSSPNVNDLSPVDMYVSPISPLYTVYTPAIATANETSSSCYIPSIITNTSAQIRYRLIASDAGIAIYIATVGWEE